MIDFSFLNRCYFLSQLYFNILKSKSQGRSNFLDVSKIRSLCFGIPKIEMCSKIADTAQKTTVGYTYPTLLNKLYTGRHTAK